MLSFSFTLSPALISISSIGLCAAGLWLTFRYGIPAEGKTLSILFILFFAGTALSMIWTQNADEALRKAILKLPLLFFPLLLRSFLALKEKHIRLCIAVFLYAVFLPAAVSVYNYFLNKELFDALILESKPLPVEFGYGIYHIQFSVLLALSVVTGVWSVMNTDRNERHSWLFRLSVLLILLNFIFIHILSARTGLLALYAGLLMLTGQRIGRLPVKYKIGFTVSAILLPLLFIALSSSLRNRIVNTAEDLKVVWQGRDANDYSFAMRVQAWKNAAGVIALHPLAGTGVGDAEKELYDHFGQSNPSILPANRKNPHFQLLESAVQSGLPHALILLVIMLLPLFRAGSNPLTASVCLLLFAASCFESILERQVTVVAFPVFMAFAIAAENNTTRKV